MKRNASQLCSWATVLFLCLAGSAHAAGAPQPRAHSTQPMTKQAFEAGKKKIAAQYKLDRQTCRTVKGLVREVCELEAKGKADAARAELEARHEPSPEATQNAKNVIAEANYDVARKKCEAKKGDAKDRCVEQAKLAREAGIRQAKVEKVEETGGPFHRGAAATKKAAGKS